MQSSFNKSSFICIYSPANISQLPDVHVLSNSNFFEILGEQSGYNIPEVKMCHNFTQWLSEESHNDIIQRKDDKELPEDIRRLLCDAYMCLYQSIEVSMFK